MRARADNGYPPGPYAAAARAVGMGSPRWREYVAGWDRAREEAGLGPHEFRA